LQAGTIIDKRQIKKLRKAQALEDPPGLLDPGSGTPKQAAKLILEAGGGSGGSQEGKGREKPPLGAKSTSPKSPPGKKS